MKSAIFVLKIFLCTFLILSPITSLWAHELDSTNYRLTGVTTSGLGGVFESTNYRLLSNLGQVSADPRNYSTSYRINQGPSEAFRAAQPTIQCFETDTNGTTECTSGPQELTDGGMVALCGGTGCYDKARFEIEGTQRTPTSCSGGTVTEFEDYYIHSFTTNGTFSCNYNISADILVVAGGGGGGYRHGAGGGAGGLLFEENLSITEDKTVLVGSGGSGATGTGSQALSGTNSSFGSLVAIGGGAGGQWDNYRQGLSGGSGGGSSTTYTANGTPGQGNNGGQGATTGSPYNWGGGGGAGQIGGSGTLESHGSGGDGLYYGGVFGDSFGENGWFAGGGGGGGHNPAAIYRGLGGIGGGGNGGTPNTMENGEDGLPGTGGGGGGASTSSGGTNRGGNGGTGIVLVRISKQSTTDPIGFWGLNQVSGTGAYLLDSSGNNYHGTPTGTTSTEGIIGRARSFNGSTDYIQITQGSSLLPTNITVSMWIYPTSWTHQTHTALITSRTTTNNGLMFFILSQGNLHFDWGNGSSSNRWNTGYQPPLNEWTHITFSRDSNGRYLFVNGLLENSTPSAGGHPPADTFLRLGSDAMSNQYNYQGIIDDVRIYDQALSQSEIMEQYLYGVKQITNPADTLYGIQISTDNFVNDIKCVDGSTFQPKNLSNCDINDFRTEESWGKRNFQHKRSSAGHNLLY
jgi:hypothetical protein